jgi:cytosine/adenosine deaminase-related metal-dependent hydrolase
LAVVFWNFTGMDYRKFKADHLFTGYEITGGSSVLIAREDGAIEAVIPSADAGDNVELLNGILCPGFVNCHCHLELSHMKGVIPEKTGLTDFLLSVIKQRNVSPHSIQQAIADGEREMLQNGIIAVGDTCNTPDTIAQKKGGNMYYHNFIEATGFIEANAAQRFESSYDVFSQFVRHYPMPVESNSIVPHAPYSVSKKLFEMITAFPGNRLLSMHNQETEAENDFFINGTGDFLRLFKELGIDISFFHSPGKRSLETILPYFRNNQSLILVHNVATNEHDILFTVNRQLPTVNLFYCVCPNANQYITGMLPDIDLLIKHHCVIVVGTDSLASNHQLNILEELKTIQQKFPHLDISTLLQWATINGAKALQSDTVVGSFEPGKHPGIVLIENTAGKKLTAGSTARRIL